MNILRLLTSLFFIYASNSYAAIYQAIGPDGNVQFSDIATKSAQTVQLQTINIYSANLTATTNNNNSQTQTTVTDQYTELSILSPKNQQTFYNQPQIPISFQLQPQLKSGDRITLWLDGKLFADNAASEIILQNLDRGEHAVQVKLINAAQETLISSAIITFYVQHTTLKTQADTIDTH